MLILGRRNGEFVKIGDDIIVRVLLEDNGDLRLGIDAPEDVEIVRGELLEEDEEE